MKLYISGPMSYLPAHNTPAFREAAQKLVAAGYDVIDPSENFGGDTTRDRAEYMRLDVGHVLKADGLALLDGWHSSKGASLEVAIAQELGLRTASVDAWISKAPWPPTPASLPGRVLNKGGTYIHDNSEVVMVPKSETILEEAQRLVHGDRGHAYGPPSKDFSRTALMWTALFGEKLREGAKFYPQDVGLGMIAVKLSREVNKHKRDSLVDVAGYAETVQLVHEDLGRDV